MDKSVASHIRHFVFVLYPDVSISSIAGAMEVLEQAVLERQRSAQDDTPIYRLSLVSRQGGTIASYFGVGMQTAALSELDDVPIHTLFICGGLGFREAMQDAELIRWIGERAGSVSRLCTSGTGSFLLAATGLLDGRSIATHWLMNDEFAAMFPLVKLVRDKLYLHERDIWTSAGMGSSIDFALALLEDDLGRDFAFKIAQRVLIFLRRSGDEPQISSMLRAQSLEGARFDRLHEWIYANLKADLTIETLAARVAMSPRNFSRVYFAKMGITPANAIARMRLEIAKEAVQRPDARLSTIAYDCGFGDEQRMRRAFIRMFGKSPLEIRAEAMDGEQGRSGTIKDPATNEKTAPS